jgi:hypothetical protein
MGFNIFADFFKFHFQFLEDVLIKLVKAGLESTSA